jgi:glutamine synthetase
MLAAGLDGIEKEMDPGTRNDDNLYEVAEGELERRGIEFLPSTLKDALDRLEEDEVIIEALGREYAEYYIEVKREEWRSYHQSISQWELDRYLPVH